MSESTPANTKNVRPIFTRLNSGAELDLLAGIHVSMLYLRYADVGPEWDTQTAPRCDGMHYIHFVTGGGATITPRDGSLLTFKPGQAYWLPAHAPVCAHVIGHYAHYFLAFRCEAVAGLDLFSDWQQPLHLGPWPIEHFTRCWQQSVITLQDLWQAKCLVETLLAQSFSELAGVVERQKSMQVKFKQAFELVDRKPDAHLMMNDLAAAQGLSAASFSRLFRRNFGCSPKLFFSRRLNQKACQMLLGTDLSSKQIAYKLNFSDEYYFSRFFKKMNGKSPAIYRRTIRQL